MAAFNCYSWTSIIMELTYFIPECPLDIKGQSTHDCSHVALIAHLGEPSCTGNAEVVGSSPVQSLKIVSCRSFFQ